MYAYKGKENEAAAALQMAIDTERIAFAPSLALFHPY